MDRRVAGITVVGVLHALAIWALGSAIRDGRVQEPPVMVMVGTIISARQEPMADPTEGLSSQLARLRDTKDVLRDIAVPEIVLVLPPTGPMAAPQLDDGTAANGLQSYAKRAGLRQGEGASVVLRVEVLATGATGRVLVDVSSGHHRIDAQAMALARAQHWKPALIDGLPSSVWIRWGVHLQG